MRVAVCAFACLVLAASSALAQPFDKAKLRQTIEMPAISTSLGVVFKASERDPQGNKYDPAQKIADLQKKLTGVPDDASIYLEQHAICVECLKDAKKARELAIKAENVLRAHMQTEDASKGHLLTLYGAVLEILFENPWNDCEKWARRAVSIAPKDWRTWEYLAHTRLQQIPSVLVGGDDKRLPAKGRSQEVLGSLYARRLRAEHVDDAEKVLNEALQHHDKAKLLAPNEAKRQEQRYAFRVREVMLRNAFAAFRSQKPPFPMGQLERTLLDELDAAARLQPDHLLWQSQLADQLIILGWQQKDNAGKPIKKFTPARPEDAQTIRTAIGRMEANANAARGEPAAFCHSMIAALCASMEDHAGAEKHARKVLQIDPQRQTAAEQLLHALMLQGKKAEQLQAAQTLLETHRTSRNCYLTAKALVQNQRYDLAEQMCLAGIKLNASDVHCLLGLASLAMRKGDDMQTLLLARDALDKARRELRPDAGMGPYVELEYLAAVHQALSGEAAIARQKLERMHLDNPDVPRYEKALRMIGQ